LRTNYVPLVSVVQWSEILTTNLEVLGPIPGATNCVAVGLEGVHSALVRINEELLERKVAAPV
jgi:hypothetical protein